jgi:hypothetical protein
MYKFRINRERNSFKFGVVAGVCLFLALESVVSLLTTPQMQVTRYLLAVIFSVVGLLCSYLGCVKK